MFVPSTHGIIALDKVALRYRYARQTEQTINGGHNCQWQCFVDWAVPYITLHRQQAEQQLKMPLVIEEFGGSVYNECVLLHGGPALFVGS